MRNRIDHFEAFRGFVVCKQCRDAGEDLLEDYASRAALHLHESRYALTERTIRHTDHGGIADRRMGGQYALDLDR